MIRAGHPTLERRRVARASEILLDGEFADLIPQPSREEQLRLRDRLLVEGPIDPLVVWRRSGGLYLVVGYDLFPVLREFDIEFEIVEKEFQSVPEARFYALREHQRRPQLTALAQSYLRGVYYCEWKPSAARDGTQEVARWGKTADALSGIFGVSLATMRRDIEVAKAVHKLMELHGKEIKNRLLGWEARLSRDGLLALAGMPESERKPLVGQLMISGKIPRGWRAGGTGGTITVPVERRKMIETIDRRLGWEELLLIQETLADYVLERRPGFAAESVAIFGRGPVLQTGAAIGPDSKSSLQEIEKSILFV